MIELINVKKKYKNKVLFSKVNIKITKPGIYTFVGENGCGKSTLLNLIAGFIKPSKGKIINKVNNYSFVSQKVNLLEDLTIEEHFKMLNMDINILRKVNMISTRNKYPKELSFGMKQRVAVLIGLYSDSSLIICDEPTSHLDFYNASLIMKEIKKISTNKIVLLVCHDEKIINKYSDEIYLIKGKKIKLIKSNTRNNKLYLCKNNKKVKKNIYYRNSFRKNIKINFYYFSVFFFLMFVLNFTINLKESISLFMEAGETGILDYNKFYLKECEKEVDGKITIKKCFNLREEKINLIKESDNKLSLNYDVFLNDLYDVNNLSVVSNNVVHLKEGRYPLKYNEVVVGEEYDVGDQITLETVKIIKDKKVDIYTGKLILNVVGISNRLPFIKDEKIYFDCNLIEEYFKRERLINNNISLFEHFCNIDVNNYKYVLYFKEIDLGYLKENNIEYLSASYDYHNSLKEVFEQLVSSMKYLSLFICFSTVFNSYRLIKKRANSKVDDIAFFKAYGLSKNKIIRLINRENNFLILLSGAISFLFNSIIVWLIFKYAIFNFFFFIFILLLVVIFNKYLFKKEIERRITV